MEEDGKGSITHIYDYMIYGSEESRRAREELTDQHYHRHIIFISKTTYFDTIYDFIHQLVLGPAYDVFLGCADRPGPSPWGKLSMPTPKPSETRPETWEVMSNLHFMDNIRDWGYWGYLGISIFMEHSFSTEGNTGRSHLRRNQKARESGFRLFKLVLVMQELGQLNLMGFEAFSGVGTQ